MIAQVWIGKGTAGPISDEVRRFTEATIAEARTHDGCEAAISMADPTTGDALTIILFRDQKALDEFQSFVKQKTAEAAELGSHGSIRVYTEVVTAL
jgi:hypothetical protein